MLQINQLSYWEKNSYLENIDYLVIGAGITGYGTALYLRKQNPNAKIVLIERGYLPTGASSKNAGFACFGSATELIDDLNRFDEDIVWSTLEMRWRGLKNLISIIGNDHLDLQINGSWDLITENERNIAESTKEKIDYLNQKTFEITGEKNVYAVDSKVSKTFGFNNVDYSFTNRLEGQIDTGKMIRKFHQLILENNILPIFGIEAKTIESHNDSNEVITNIGSIKASKIAICTNGFAQQFLPKEDVFPARAQVIITKPIENLQLKGTFHYQQGYYYFRNIHNRILLGGGRNLDFKGETTTEFEQTKLIQDSLSNLLNEVIAPGKNYEIDYTWSGIMGVGNDSKKPIIKKINNNIAIGVRMGGMGVAIGSLVGEEVANLLSK
jgi:gamma-glutamylputrescine oxidase